jgi:hypothetical protein
MVSTVAVIGSERVCHAPSFSPKRTIAASSVARANTQRFCEPPVPDSPAYPDGVPFICVLVIFETLRQVSTKTPPCSSGCHTWSSSR